MSQNCKSGVGGSRSAGSLPALLYGEFLERNHVQAFGEAGVYYRELNIKVSDPGYQSSNSQPIRDAHTHKNAGNLPAL